MLVLETENVGNIRVGVEHPFASGNLHSSDHRNRKGVDRSGAPTVLVCF